MPILPGERDSLASRTVGLAKPLESSVVPNFDPNRDQGIAETIENDVRASEWEVTR